ncbi:MAG: hypothetical protein JXR37_23900, partial [Kiritimatiellae bacterium]|nr:hypothetical protein [Kiritimatiellia bacterium]
ELAVLESSVAPDDSDADGLSDAWETAHFGSTGAANGGTGDDFDGDGLLNIEEYVMGSDPAADSGAFEVELSMAGSAVLVSFMTLEATGTGYVGLARYYALQQCGNPAAGTWQAVPGYDAVLGQGQTVCYTNSSPAAATHYRGRVWLE